LIVKQADQRFNRWLDVPAAGIRLDVAVSNAVRRCRRERNGVRRLAVTEGEGLHEAVARLDHIRRSLDTQLRKQRGLQALARGVSGVEALDVGATVDESEQPRRARAAMPSAFANCAVESARSLPAAAVAPNTPTAAAG